MSDFQNLLRLIIEEDETPEHPGANIDSAKTPAEAYLAYKREFGGLWLSLKTTLLNSNKALENLGGHIDGYTGNSLNIKDVDSAVDKAYSPTKSRPTIVRNTVRSMTDRGTV